MNKWTKTLNLCYALDNFFFVRNIQSQHENPSRYWALNW